MDSRRDSADGPGNVDGASERRSTMQERLESGILARLKHFTWAWYTLPMATGGLAVLLSPSIQPHSFPGLDIIGKIVYVYDLVIFTLVTAAISYRFTRWPGTLKESLTHPTESLYFGTSLLSLASIISSIEYYGVPSCGPWLITVYRVLFWIYCTVTFLVAVGQYYVLFTNPALKFRDMTPAWDLPIFPFMLSGTIARVGAASQSREHAIPMLVAGLTAQGLGFWISLLMYASYMRRMITFGFPSPHTRPAMFIAVGPPSFTSLALIGMADDYALRGQGYAFLGTDADLTSQVLQIVATVAAIFLWSLSFWFFCISFTSCFAVAVRRQLPFRLNWWSFVFPNVGFTIATIDIGTQLQSQGVLWVGTAMTIALVCVYLFVLVHQVRAVYLGRILSEGKDEDVYVKEEHRKRDVLGQVVQKAENPKGD